MMIRRTKEKVMQEKEKAIKCCYICPKVLSCPRSTWYSDICTKYKGYCARLSYNKYLLAEKGVSNGEKQDSVLQGVS